MQQETITIPTTTASPTVTVPNVTWNNANLPELDRLASGLDINVDPSYKPAATTALHQIVDENDYVIGIVPDPVITTVTLYDGLGSDPAGATNGRLTVAAQDAVDSGLFDYPGISLEVSKDSTVSNIEFVATDLFDTNISDHLDHYYVNFYAANSSGDALSNFYSSPQSGNFLALTEVPYTLVQSTPIGANNLGFKSYLVSLNLPTINLAPGSYVLSIYDREPALDGLSGGISSSSLAANAVRASNGNADTTYPVGLALKVDVTQSGT